MAGLGISLDSIGIRLEDVDEETYECFTQRAPMTNLGMLDSKATSVTVELDDKLYEIRQSPGLLTSSRSTGTTGAALWKVTLAVAEWMVDANCSLWTAGLLNSNTIVVELGCGIAGLIGICLAPKILSYILTDQAYVMKVLRENVDANYRPTSSNIRVNRNAHTSKAQAPLVDSKLQMLTYDWESDSVPKLNAILAPEHMVDIVIICDCIYNEFLIPPLAATCKDLCERSPQRQTILLIAQQLRTEDIFQLWMEELSKNFDIWRLKESKVPPTLQPSAGFVIHLAMLKH